MFQIENGVLLKYTGKEDIIVIPEGVHTIGENAFNYADTEVYEPTQLTTKEGTLEVDTRGFESNKHIKEVIFPSTLKTIRKRAFYRCNLTSVKFPSSLRLIEDGAFEHNSIEHLELNHGLKSIGSRAFIYNNLAEVFIPATVKYIQKDAFSYCRLKTAEFENISKLVKSHTQAFKQSEGEAEIIFSIK